MTMLGLSALVLLAVLGYRHMSGGNPLPEPTGQLPTAGQDPHTTTQAPSHINAPPEQAGKVLGATRAVDILSRNDAAFAGPGERIYLRMQIATLCDDTLIKNPPLSTRLTNHAHTKLKLPRTFCQGATVSLEQELAHLMALPADDPYTVAYGMAAELFEAGQPAGISKQEAGIIPPLLSDIMLSEQAGFDAVIAAEALQQVNYVAPGIQTLARTDGWGLSREQLAQAQVLASRLRACTRYGGCGPGQLRTMQACRGIGACEVTDTAESLWRQEYSPRVYAAAQAITKLRRVKAEP